MPGFPNVMPQCLILPRVSNFDLSKQLFETTRARITNPQFYFGGFHAKTLSMTPKKRKSYHDCVASGGTRITKPQQFRKLYFGGNTD